MLVMVKQTPSSARLSPGWQSENKAGTLIVTVASEPKNRIFLTSPIPSTIPVNM
jgi:hypothetical protein